MSRKDLKQFFRNQAQKIRVYTSLEYENDPYESDVTRVYNNPKPIKAIVADLTSTQLNWKMPGIVTTGGKEIIIEKKHKGLLELSAKIEIEGVDYYGFRINGKLEYRNEHDYIRAYIYRKEESNA